MVRGVVASEMLPSRQARCLQTTLMTPLVPTLLRGDGDVWDAPASCAPASRLAATGGIHRRGSVEDIASPDRLSPTGAGSRPGEIPRLRSPYGELRSG